ncbi:hypothetical protein JXA84_08990, partial [candidate division WOR-3 bacterium]|nr:hypothetical protein [candidate division WOR-3 bacterium]
LSEYKNTKTFKTVKEYKKIIDDFVFYEDKRVVKEKLQKFITKAKEVEKVHIHGPIADRELETLKQDYVIADIADSDSSGNPQPIYSKKKYTDQIKKFYNKLKDHIYELNKFYPTIRNNPESSTLITVSILLSVILFFAGVIYPLSFLPLNVDSKITLSFYAFFPLLFSLKGIILAIISVIYTGIMVYFRIENRRLKYKDEKILSFSEFLKVETYSKYFKYYEKE